MPRWNAATDASSVACAIACRSAGGSPRGTTFASVCVWAWRSAAWPPGLSARTSTPSASDVVNCAATIAPIAATPSRLATRAIALLTPDAIPALCSSASARTVAVSGATVSDSPREKTSRPGSTSVT